MKKDQHLSKYFLIMTILLLAGALLAACDTAATPVSAAQTEMNFLAESENSASETGMDAEQIAPAEILEVAGAPEANVEPETEAAVQSESNTTPAQGQAYGQGQGQQGNGTGQAQGAHVDPTGELSGAEIAALQYMREEEKLARDIYQALYDEWGVPVFSNIAGSEQAHMDAVAYLLDAYGIADPAANSAPGVFVDQSLQELYNQLLAQGRQSLTDALLVGAAIEEIDILDLQERLAQTENQAVIQTFNNLLQGSVNHLSAFSSNLQRQTGQAYKPQYMDAATYEGLLASAASQGYGAGGAGSGYGSQGAGSGSSNGGGQGTGTGAGNSGSGQGQGRGQGQGQGQGGGRGRP